MLVSHDSAVSQGEDTAAKVLKKQVSPLQGIPESCPDFTVFQLEHDETNFRDERPCA
jgi:hypothetical protein